MFEVGKLIKFNDEISKPPKICWFNQFFSVLLAGLFLKGGAQEKNEH